MPEMIDAKDPRKEIRKILDELATRRQKKIITTSVRSGRRADVIVVGKRGHYVRHRKPQDEIVKDIAILPTITAAITRGGRNFKISQEDIREKVRRKKISSLLTIVFDGSSSMIKDDKIGSIKDVLQEILLDAYQKRDRVSLVIFNGQAAKVVLPFTTSVESAKKYLETVSYGGTTPLSSGLLTGLEMLEMKLLAEPESIPIMIVITDGTHNVPINPGADIHRELMEICTNIRESAISMLLIDVSRGGSPLAKEIADKCGAKYFVVRSGKEQETKIDYVNQELAMHVFSLVLIDNQLGNILVRGCSENEISNVLDNIDQMSMEIEVVEGCRYNCNPRKPEEFCSDCVQKYGTGKAPLMLQPVRIQRIDGNTTVEQLRGTAGPHGFNRGVLGRVNRGILYINGIDKLGVDVINALSKTLNTRTNVITTDGEPIVHPSRFVLIGRTSEPNAKIPAPLHVHMTMLLDPLRMSETERKARRIGQQKEYDIDSRRFVQNLKKKNKENLFRIIRARTLLPNIQTPDHQLDIIGRICVESNVSSNYTDILIERIGRVNAAYEGRMTLEMHDILTASEYVLPLFTNRKVSSARELRTVSENIEKIREWVTRHG